MLRVLTALLFSMAVVCAEETGWAFKAPRKQPIPEVKNKRRAHNPVDAFVLERLMEEGLRPSREADRRTLVRRLYTGLHGLAPTVEQYAPTLSYEELVDELLESPRFGEKFARYWLDTIHFAETHGYDKDKARRNAWPYRDYVIRSFNEDKQRGEGCLVT